MPKTPSRIISLVPSQTELLVDLGLKDQIVGVTHFCVHPAGLKKEKVIVGGTKNVRIKKIQGLNPDFILCNKEENTREMVEKLETIAPVWVTDMMNIEDCNEMILQMGSVFQVKKKALKIVEKINFAKEDFLGFMKGKSSKKVLYVIWKEPYMAAGRNTFINELLKLNKFENVLTSPESRYPEVNFSDFKELELVLLSTEPYPFKESHVEEQKAKSGLNVKLVDGEFFSWYGSRMIKAFEYFKTLHR